MDFARLERRLVQRPASPLFARVAEGYVLAERFKEAEELCRAGLAKYPHYATARIILARCLAGTGRRDESLEILKKVLAAYPDSGVVRGLVAEITSKSVSIPLVDSSSVASVEVSAVITRTEVTGSAEIAVEKVVEPPLVVPAEVIPPQVEAILRAPLIVAAPVIETQPEPVLPKPKLVAVIPVAAPQAIADDVIDDGRIVSKTLAEIYAGQGAYEEAIHTYKLLRKKNPAQTASIDSRIAELQARLSSSPR